MSFWKPEKKKIKQEILFHPELPDFLNSRVFEENKHVDFAESATFQYTQKKDELGRTQHFIQDGKTTQQISLEYEPHLLKLTAHTPFETFNLHHEHRVCQNASYGVLRDGKVLSPPYFYYICYYKTQHVFMAVSYPLDGGNIMETGYDRFWIDTKGRLLGMDKGNYMSWLPNYVYFEKENRFEEITLLGTGAKLTHWEDILGEDLFRVNFHPYCGLMNRKGKIIVPAEYDRIEVSKGLRHAIAVKDKTIYHIELNSGISKRVLSGEIIYIAHDKLLVEWYTDDFKDLSCVINFEGERLIKPFHGSIQFSQNPELFMKYSGELNFKYGERYTDDFHDHLDPNSFNGDMFGGVQEANKWGLIHENEKEILPHEYAWIASINETSFVANKGGAVYTYLDGEDDYDVYCVVGGTWILVNDKGEELKRFKPEDYNKVIDPIEPKIYFEEPQQLFYVYTKEFKFI